MLAFNAIFFHTEMMLICAIGVVFYTCIYSGLLRFFLIQTFSCGNVCISFYWTVWSNFDYIL